MIAKKLFKECGFFAFDIDIENISYDYLLEENLESVSTSDFPQQDSFFSNLYKDEPSVYSCENDFVENCSCSFCQNRIGIHYFFIFLILLEDLLFW